MKLGFSLYPQFYLQKEPRDSSFKKKRAKTLESLWSGSGPAPRRCSCGAGQRGHGLGPRVAAHRTRLAGGAHRRRCRPRPPEVVGGSIVRCKGGRHGGHRHAHRRLRQRRSAPRSRQPRSACSWCAVARCRTRSVRSWESLSRL